jgi:hypothetical protein
MKCGRGVGLPFPDFKTAHSLPAVNETAQVLRIGRPRRMGTLVRRLTTVRGAAGQEWPCYRFRDTPTHCPCICSS